MPSERDIFAELDEAPFLGAFVDAAFVGYEQDGAWRIPDERRRELMGSLCLSPSETAAYAYLAEKRAADIHEVFEDEVLVTHIDGGSSE